jgi:hypothetical protein
VDLGKRLSKYALNARKNKSNFSKGKDMCDFFSFVICSDGKVLTGDGESHYGISIGWNLARGSYREAEWVGEEWNSLSVRVEEGEDKNCWLSNVLAICPTKKRSDFLKLFTVGKNGYGVFHLKDGKPHRTDGPAYEGVDGGKVWWVNGKLHRTDGPACEWTDGKKEWHVDGKRHRTDGPAIEWADGSKWWYVNGKCHRTDGPAYEDVDGSKSWWVGGRQYSKEEFNKLTF